MSITRINTNADSLLAAGQLRNLEYNLSKTLQKLSTGLRINTAADDPSGVALAGKFKAHLGGVRQAITNAQDALNMMATADAALNETMDMLQRMRDLSVKAANEAVLTSADVVGINDEIQNLKTEINRRAGSLSFNTKVLFSGALGTAAGGQAVQIGATNGTAYRLTVTIGTMTLTALDLSDAALWGANAKSLMISNTAATQYVSLARLAIDVIQSAINTTSNIQQAIGVQERNLESIINDLSTEEVNVAASTSRITDADMAAEVSNFTRLQVLTQSTTAMLAQANLQPQNVLSLLGL